MERFEKFKMSDKIAAKRWFIMKVVCINVEVVLFSVYSAYNGSVFITNFLLLWHDSAFQEILDGCQDGYRNEVILL